MVACNNIYWLKENLFIRFWGIVIWLIGFAIFLFFAMSGCREFSYVQFSNTLEKIIFILKYVLFFPGLIPLVIGGFFLVLFRESQDFFIGAFVILPAFIFLHYIVAGVSAHDDGLPSLGLQLFEILCAIAVIIKYQRKWKRLATL